MGKIIEFNQINFGYEKNLPILKDVSFTINGTVDVRLQYGSDGDQRRDDGYVTNMSFPFRADVSAQGDFSVDVPALA